MYKIRTDSESLLEPTLLKQKLQLLVLARDSKIQKLYYWDNRVNTYLNLGHLASDSETISDYIQLTGSIHSLLGAIAYLILPGFESLGKIQFGYTNHYEWSREREWEPEDLAALSPYLTSHIKRFGDYLIDLDNIPAALEEQLNLSF